MLINFNTQKPDKLLYDFYTVTALPSAYGPPIFTGSAGIPHLVQGQYPRLYPVRSDCRQKRVGDATRHQAAYINP